MILTFIGKRGVRKVAVWVATASGLAAFPGTPAAQAQTAPGQKSIFDFDDDPKTAPPRTTKPPVLVKPETPTSPATTAPTTPPATPPSTPPVTPPATPPATPPSTPETPVIPTTPRKPPATANKGPVVNPGAPVTAAKTSLGLSAETYSGSSFDKVTATRVVPRVSVKVTHDPNATPPENGIAPVSVRWRGLIRAPQAGTYRFRLMGNAQTAVYIGSETTFWGGPPPAKAFSGRSVELQDALYPIIIEASNISATADVRLTLEWMLFDGFDWEAVPASAMCRAIEGGTTTTVTTTTPRTTKPGPGIVQPPAKPEIARPIGPTPLPKGATPVPDEPSQVEARKRLRTANAAALADTRPLAKQALAKLLAGQAFAPSANMPDRYVMLREAAEQYASAGDIPAAMEVVKSAVSSFDVDEATFAIAAFNPIASKAGRTVEQSSALADGLLSAAERTLAGGNADSAGKAADVAANVARTSIATSARFKPRADRFKEIRTELQRLTPMLAKLKANPSDVEAGGRVGKFHALLANNWDLGLPMLARSADVELKLLADMEKAAIPDKAEQLKLADAWWDHAAREKEPYASASRSRAAAWYELILRKETDATTIERLNDRIVTAADSINLLAMADPRRDGLRGQWRWAGRDLFCEGRGNCALQFPFAPRGDYDFAVEFSVTAGNIHFMQLMPGAASTFTWGMFENYMSFGYEMSSGFFPNSKSTAGISGKQHHVSVVRVRGNNIKAYVDGKLAGEWRNDPKGIKGPRDWQLNDPTCLGFGCLESQVAIHGAKLVELPNAGK